MAKPVNKAAIEAAKTAIGSVSLAHTLVQKLEGNEEFKATVESLIQAKEDVAMGPYSLWQVLSDIYSEEEMASFPVPDTEKGETGNRPFDIEYIPVPKNDGGTKKTRVSFYDAFAKEHSIGAALQKRIRWLTKEGEGEAPAEITHMGEIDKRSELQKVKARFGNFRNYIKKAMALHFQLIAVQSLPGVNCYPRTITKDGQEIFVDTPYPIVVEDKEDRAKFAAMSVSQFLGLDPEKAKENGGTWTALIDTKKRGARGGDNEGPAMFGNVNEAWNAQSMLQHYYEENANVNAILNKFNGKDGDARVLEFGEFFIGLRAIYAKIEKRHQRLLAAQAEQPEENAA